VCCCHRCCARFIVWNQRECWSSLMVAAFLVHYTDCSLHARCAAAIGAVFKSLRLTIESAACLDLCIDSSRALRYALSPRHMCCSLLRCAHFSTSDHRVVREGRYSRFFRINLCVACSRSHMCCGHRRCTQVSTFDRRETRPRDMIVTSLTG
jgi:hypothetical protein